MHSGPASERGTVQAPRRAPPEEHFTSRKLNAGFAHTENFIQRLLISPRKTCQ